MFTVYGMMTHVWHLQKCKLATDNTFRDMLQVLPFRLIHFKRVLGGDPRDLQVRVLSLSQDTYKFDVLYTPTGVAYIFECEKAHDVVTFLYSKAA